MFRALAKAQCLSKLSSYENGQKVYQKCALHIDNQMSNLYIENEGQPEGNIT